MPRILSVALFLTLVLVLLSLAACDGPNARPGVPTLAATPAQMDRPAPRSLQRAARSGGTGDAPAPAGTGAPALPADRFVELVPADSPYVWATLPSASSELGLDFDVWGPLLDTAATGLQAQLRALDEVPFATLAAAAFDELRAHYSRAGLAELGLLAAPRFALFGVGPFPVLRLEIADRQAATAALERIDRRGGFSPELRTTDDGRTVRVYASDAWRAAVHVSDVALVVAVAPEQVLDDVLTAAMREEPEAGLVASSMLQDTAAALLPDATTVGFIDVAGLARGFAGDPNSPSQYWLARAGLEAPVLGEVCTPELSRLAAAIPRLTFASVDRAGGQEAVFGVAVADASLVEALGAMATDVPELPTLDPSGAWAALAVGADLGTLATLATALGQDVLARPFACQDLMELNVAAELLRDLGAAVPEFMRAGRGLFLLVTAANVTARGVSNIEGVLLVPSKTPASLWRMAKSAPKKVKLPPRGVPSPLELPEALGFLGEAGIIANKTSLVVTAGESGAAKAEAVANLHLGDKVPLVALTYDYGRLMAVYTDSLPAELETTSRDALRQQLLGLGVVTLALETSATGLVARYRLDLRAPAAE